MYHSETDNIIYAVHESEIQSEAERRLGKKLNADELHSAKKGIEWTFDWMKDDMYDTIFSNIKSSSDEDEDEEYEEEIEDNHDGN